MSAEQCVIRAMRGVHLEYVAPGKWRLSGETNISEVVRDDTGWEVYALGVRIGHYRMTDVALAHAYSVASDPVKRVA